MKTIKYTSWKDCDVYEGYLVDYPQYHFQGRSKEELEGHMRDFLLDVESSSEHKSEESVVSAHV